MRPSLRKLIKTGVAHAVTKGGVDALVRNRHRQYPLVICHHRVLPESEWTADINKPMLLSPSAFERELDWLQEHYRFIRLEDMSAQSVSANGVKPAVAISFDDGYADIYEHAFPILERRGIPATLFVVTDLVDTDEVPLHDRLFVLLSTWWRRYQPPAHAFAGLLRDVDIDPRLLAGLDLNNVTAVMRALLKGLPQSRARMLARALEEQVVVDDEVWKQFRSVNWDMLDEMSGSVFTIGSHTRSHVLLPNESDAIVKDEVTRSRAVLERHLGRPVDLFAYPDGRFDARVVRAVAEAGYRLAFGCCAHRDPDFPHLTVPRKHLWQNCCLDSRGEFSPAIASCQVERVFDLLRPCRQDHGAGSPPPPAVQVSAR